MSKLEECHASISTLLRRIADATKQYDRAARLLEFVENHEDEATLAELLRARGFDMTINVGDIKFPFVSFTTSRATVLNVAESAMNVAGFEVMDLWDQVYEVTLQAHQHCETARQRVKEPEVPLAPPPLTQPAPFATQAINLEEVTKAPASTGHFRTTPIGS
jgi:hypothetical protein